RRSRPPRPTPHQAVGVPVTEIIEFLRARLNEDEQHARNATPGPWDADHVRTRGEMAVLSEWGSVVAAYAGSDNGYPAHPEPMDRGDAEHIARWSPKRVLAEVEAKRCLLARHDRIGTRRVGHPRAARAVRCRMGCGGVRPCETGRLLALPCSQHLHCREEWGPSWS